MQRRARAGDGGDDDDGGGGDDAMVAGDDVVEMAPLVPSPPPGGGMISSRQHGARRAGCCALCSRGWRRSWFPEPPRILVNVSLWCLTLTVMVFLVAGGWAAWRSSDWIATIRDVSSADGGPMSMESFVWNTLMSRTGVGILKRLLVTLSEESERVLLFDKERHANPLLIDVSAGLEFQFIWRRMLSQPTTFPADDKRVVVDIGAYDGVLGSNSYNLLQMGWRGLLAEPFHEIFLELGRNTHKFGPRVTLVNAAVSDWHGKGELTTFGDASQLSSTLLKVNYSFGRAPKSGSVTVDVLRASEMLAEHSIPKDFGVLSVDAEGVGGGITKDILAAGYRPRFIVFEWEGASDADIAELHKGGYTETARIGNNSVYEHTTAG